MAYEHILVEREDGVGIVTLNRPDVLNAMNRKLGAELLDAVKALDADGAIGCLVITGAGDKAFIAGADISEFAERTPVQQRAAMHDRPIFDEIAAFPKPMIAMINGFALGGGCEVALACDMRIAAKSARLGQPEIKLGIIPGGGGTQRLPRLVGVGTAMRLVLSGELIGAEEAYRIGLVDVVVEDAQLEARTYDIAGAMAAQSSLALRLAKSAIRASEEMPLGAGLAYERELFITAFGSNDKREGVAAFLEKRAPEFRGD